MNTDLSRWLRSDKGREVRRFMDAEGHLGFATHMSALVKVRDEILWGDESFEDWLQQATPAQIAEEMLAMLEVDG